MSSETGMTKRVREDPITIDDPQTIGSCPDKQGPDCSRLGLTILYTAINVCNPLLDDLVIDSGTQSDVNNGARGPDQPRSHDCSTHVTVDDSRRICPRSVLQADTIYRELWTGEF